MAWLDDHPPARSQFRRPRRQAVSGVIVVHTAESPADISGPDTAAENVANFIRHRDTPGSYHDLCDSDSCINLVGYDAEAFQDGTGSNPHALSISAAVRTVDWATMPTARRDATVAQMAAAARRQAAWVFQTRGIVIPARRISRAQSDALVPGFISHAQRDPARRTDPGADFPWNQFLALFEEGGQEEDDDMYGWTEEEFKDVVRNLIRQELYGDPDGHNAGVKPIIQDEVRELLHRELTTSGSTTRVQLRELAKLGCEDALPDEPTTP